MRSSVLTWAWTVAAAVIVVTGCSTQPVSQTDSGPPTHTAATAHTAGRSPSPRPTRVRSSSTARPSRPLPTHGQGSALAALDHLEVKGRAPTTGYDRDRFGPAWLDANRNGCDTRNDILGRDLTHVRYRAGTHDCVVTTGDLADPYTGTRIRFVEGNGDLVDIDHVVALGDVWVTGGSRWPIKKRAAIANDPYNLLAVDAGANRQKGDGDAATWLPPNKAYRCAYVARQVAVKAKYGLWVTPAERDAIARVLRTCPLQQLPPDTTHAPTDVTNNIEDPGAPGQSSSAPPPAPLASGGGCEPGYSPCLPITGDLDCGDIPDSEKPIRVTGSDPYRLDGDGNGWACTS